MTSLSLPVFLSDPRGNQYFPHVEILCKIHIKWIHRNMYITGGEGLYLFIGDFFDFLQIGTLTA
jgi:hypothetical protein